MEFFGPYRLEALIGQGGMGEVHRAFDTRRERPVALKRLKPGVESDADYQERFRRESSLAARLSSPHVIPIHDFGEINGRLFIDMRLALGPDLGKMITMSGPLPTARIVEIVRQVADALDSAHEEGLIHRDVKPSNILITNNHGQDFAYLVDFGIVRAGTDIRSSLTATGSAIGTLAYMAPELFTGAQIDRRVDVYALGCLLFEALTGRPPFTADGVALMYQHLNDDPPQLSATRPDIGPGFDPVISRAMVKDPNTRFDTAGELAKAAQLALSSGSRATPPESALPTYVPSRTAGGDPPPTPTSVHPVPTPDPPRRHGKLPIVLGALGGAALLIGLIVIGVWTQSSGSTPTAAPTTATSPRLSPTPSVPDTLAGVFLDIGANGNCTPFQPQGHFFTLNDGTKASEVVTCPVTAQGGNVFFAQWPTAVSAQQFYNEAKNGQVSIDGKNIWVLGGATQGDVYTGNYSDGSAFSLFTYNGSRYTFTVDANDVASVNDIFTHYLQLRTVGMMPS